ncbi:hypothetical protein C3K47_11260 [Solitalea longa]|uniref:Uncharacterized protein n=1 Tax=Solitalea longa TaxID=2079460 RepID=A0A2S5A162_9SPHI|nr:hypothetical protein C3K47_11260 [Solitalea longa]
MIISLDIFVSNKFIAKDLCCENDNFLTNETNWKDLNRYVSTERKCRYKIYTLVFLMSIFGKNEFRPFKQDFWMKKSVTSVA